VLDPELDRSLVALGFVRRVEVRGGEVQVELQLPTYWCAPNFSWLMAADARRALLQLPGVERATVLLVDHHDAEQINRGVNAGRSFQATYGAEASAGLEDLRRLFRAKAFLVRQDRLLDALADRDPRTLRIGDLPDSPEAQAYLAIRRELGLDCSPEAPVLTTAAGQPIADVEAHLRRARMVRVSLEANTVLCRGLLAARTGRAEPPRSDLVEVARR
jgi:metal-sulfur cluster biosynthetic enzyme